MSLKERIKKLAKERGISLPALESELGFGNSTIVKWDKSMPNAEKLNSVAKYFSVSMDYLMNGSEDNEINEESEKDIAKDVENIIRKLLSEESGPVIYDGEEISSEAADLFRDEIEIALKRLKIMNKEQNSFKKNSNSLNDNLLLNAAHADNYADASDELKQLEEDIMDDENF